MEAIRDNVDKSIMTVIIDGMDQETTRIPHIPVLCDLRLDPTLPPAAAATE
jgi:hypothetical protein